MTTEGAMTGPAPSETRSFFVGDLTRGTLVAAAIAVCVGQVALAIPAVLNGLFQLDLGTSASQLTWISDAFLVPVTLLELTFGVLGDMFGRKRLLVGGALILATGELVSVLTPGTSASTDTRVLVLWIGQALAGIGAAVLFPTSLAVVAAATHNARERGRVIAIYAAALSTGGFISPVIGGLVAKLKWGSDAHASWRWAFLAVMLLALISAGVSAVWARNSSSPEGRSLDWPGQITIAISLFALLFAVIQAPTAGWGSTEVILGFVIAAVFMVLFIMAERRTRAPLLRLELFENRAFAITAFVTVLGMFAFLGTAYASSIRFASIQGFSPLRTSLAFVLLQGFALVLLPVVSWAMPRINPRWLLGGGFVLIAAGDFWASTVPVSHHSIVPMIAPLALVGIGFAFAISSVTAVAVNTVRINLAGMASATTSLLRDFGFTLGPALIGAIALSRAASTIHSQIAASPKLAHALNGFYGSVAHAPPAQRQKLAEAVGAVKSGPLGANGVPATAHLPNGHTVPLNPLKETAFHALGNAYSFGYVVCGVAAGISGLLALLILRADAHHDADELAAAESDQYASSDRALQQA
ncbi:MAG: MFS transporter [Solirubrobacteraceae bacterium]